MYRYINRYKIRIVQNNCRTISCIDQHTLDLVYYTICWIHVLMVIILMQIVTVSICVRFNLYTIFPL